MLDALREIGQTAAWVGGGLAGAAIGLDRGVALAVRMGALPERFRKAATAKAEEIHAGVVREETLSAVLEVAPIIVKLAKQGELILTAVTPNGGNSFRDAFDAHCTASTLAHDRISNNVEDLFEMIGTSHDEMANLGRQVARQALWQTKHDELTARQAAGGAS